MFSVYLQKIWQNKKFTINFWISVITIGSPIFPLLFCSAFLQVPWPCKSLLSSPWRSLIFNTVPLQSVEPWSDLYTDVEDQCLLFFQQHLAPQYKHLITIRAGKPKGGTTSDALKCDPNKVRRLSLSEQQLAKAVVNHGTEIVRYISKWSCSYY